MNKPSWEFIRFCLVGVFNTAINYGVYLVMLLFMQHHYLIAGAIGFMAGAVAGFYVNRAWTFKAQHITHHKLIIYLLVNFASLLINALIQYGTVTFLTVPELYSQLFGILVTSITNYIGVKAFVFTK